MTREKFVRARSVTAVEYASMVLAMFSTAPVVVLTALKTAVMIATAQVVILIALAVIDPRPIDPVRVHAQRFVRTMEVISTAPVALLTVLAMMPVIVVVRVVSVGCELCS